MFSFFSSNSDDQVISTSTPKTIRKWKKTKTLKQCSSGRSEQTSSQHSSALGQKIVDYPTSGDGDVSFFFPL